MLHLQTVGAYSQFEVTSVLFINLDFVGKLISEFEKFGGFCVFFDPHSQKPTTSTFYLKFVQLIKCVLGSV